MRIRRQVCWLLLFLGLGGCKRDVKHVVDRVEVVGATVTDNAILSLTPDQVQGLLVEKLSAQGSFILPKPGQKPPPETPPVRMTLELAFTRESQKDGRQGTYAEVGATLAIRRRASELSAQYDVAGLGEVKVSGDSLDERQDAVRRALEVAMERAVDAAHLQLTALWKTDEVLVKDLAAKDTRLREYALRVLAERRNPAAAEALLEKLKDDDATEVRRAIGGLVEIKDVRAVPALIDLSRGKDPSFVKEILFALGAIGGDEAEAYLYTVAEGHDQPAIREAAKQAMDELQSRQARQARNDAGRGAAAGGQE